MDTDPALRLQTLCVHAGHRPSARERSVIAPIVQSATFLLDDESYAHMLAGRSDRALIYTRLGNPTLASVQTKLAALEGADGALVFSSGMAAIHAALAAHLRAGARIVAHHELYGTAWDLLQNALPALGVRVDFADLNDPSQRAAALAQPCDVVYCESVSNPTLVVGDVSGIARAARERGATLIVDATFATPVLQRALALGAHVVVHSGTKYLAGHSDVLAGVVASDETRLRAVYRWLQLAGGCLDPHAAFLLDRGLKTLPLRMRAHVENACELARFLARHRESRARCVRFERRRDWRCTESARAGAQCSRHWGTTGRRPRSLDTDSRSARRTCGAQPAIGARRWPIWRAPARDGTLRPHQSSARLLPRH